MKQVVTLLLVMASASPAYADDASDAVEVLTNAMKCPLKPRQTLDKSFIVNPHLKSFVVNRFTGSKEFFGVETKYSDTSGIKWNRRISAKFSDLTSVAVTQESGEYGFVRVGTACLKNIKAGCLTVTTTGEQTEKSRYPNKYNFEIDICNIKNAGFAKLALETLIKLNRQKK